jgi:transposase
MFGNLFRIDRLKAILGQAKMARPEFPSDISREQFEHVRDMLEAARRKTRPRKHDLFDVFNAVLYFLSTGSAWRSMPPEFPPWRTVHEYFTQWTMLRDGDRTLLEQVLEKIGRQAELDRLRKLLTPR